MCTFVNVNLLMIVPYEVFVFFNDIQSIKFYDSMNILFMVYN